MNSKILLRELADQITLHVPFGERQQVALLLLQDVFPSLTMTSVLTETEVELTTNHQNKLQKAITRINENEPVQYVLGYEYFFGRKFFVSPEVLIPRPETEDIIRAAKQLFKPTQALTIVDFGTGSGCISITLALEFPLAKVEAVDISATALEVARRNASSLGAHVSFNHADMQTWTTDQLIDLMVSNPPYIGASEQHEMMPNVVDYEPHVALFVPDDDPLIFYKTIARHARTSLRPHGVVLVEINERYPSEVAALFQEQGFRKTEIIRDLAGKSRIVKAVL